MMFFFLNYTFKYHNEWKIIPPSNKLTQFLIDIGQSDKRNISQVEKNHNNGSAI